MNGVGRWCNNVKLLTQVDADVGKDVYIMEMMNELIL